MIAKYTRALAISAIILLMSASPVLADSEKKPGFHGWGDSQETSSEQGAVKAKPSQTKEMPEQMKPSGKAKTKQSKAVAAAKRDVSPGAELRQKIQREREAFFDDTKKLRQEIYQKRLELRSELAKSDPSARQAKSIQKEITKRRTELDRMRLEHFLKLKKIDPEMGRSGKSGRKGDGGCSNCPYQDRGDRSGYSMMGPGYGGKHHMMGPGYGRHHMWEDDGDWQRGSEKGEKKRSKKSAISKSTRKTEALSPSDARVIVKDYLKSTRNPNLKLGKVSDAGEAYQAEILTRDGSLVDTLLVDKESGAMRPAY